MWGKLGRIERKEKGGRKSRKGVWEGKQKKKK